MQIGMVSHHQNGCNVGKEATGRDSGIYLFQVLDEILSDLTHLLHTIAKGPDGLLQEVGDLSSEAGN